MSDEIAIREACNSAKRYQKWLDAYDEGTGRPIDQAQEEVITLALELDKLRRAEDDRAQLAAGAMANLAEQYNALSAELERERMRLAGCGVAALGYFDGCHQDYDSASLQDTLRVRARLDAFEKREPLVQSLLSAVRLSAGCIDPMDGYREIQDASDAVQAFALSVKCPSQADGSADDLTPASPADAAESHEKSGSDAG